jgi:hypothetical protein
MRKTLLSLLFAFTGLMSLCYQINAQEMNANTEKVDFFLKEIYRDCPEYRDSTHRAIALDCLNRTVYHKVSKDQYPECPLLSAAGKKNKCNQTMNYTDQFDPLTFNPLKYNFKYYSTNSSFYRVDGTEYIIEIVPPKK